MLIATYTTAQDHTPKMFLKLQRYFREKLKNNLTICHTVPHFNSCLFTISVKSKVTFQSYSENM